MYKRQAAIKTLIIENGPGALSRAHKIDNYYGVAASGSELYTKGLEQAKALGITVINDEVLNVEYTDSFTVHLKNTAKILTAPVLLLATGTKNITLNLPELVEFEGKGVSYCAVCDGFFFRKKQVAVLGNSAYALHEAEYLKHLATSVTILTNGKDDSLAVAAGFTVRKEVIKAIVGENKLQSIHFAEGPALNVDGLFIAMGTADSTDIARKLGAQLDGRFIKIDTDCATNIPGLFAAGDCTGGLMQIAKAVHEGARAGLAALKFIRTNKI